ncbi:hypothetical protein PHMEG_00029946, partial [Phytophthora megakarya]
MRNWILDKKETIRNVREITSVDLEKLRFADGVRDFTSVIAVLQTMLHDAGYAFLNLVPTWGRTLSPELLAAQDGQFMSDASFLWGLLTIEQVAWNEIARGRNYSVRRDDAPFRALDPETAFPVEDDGDALMLTLEEQELLGTAMVTRLRLAHVRPRDWSESDSSQPEPKRRRGSTDAPLSVPSWPGSDETTRVWGGPCWDPPGMEPSTAMVGVYMVTTGSGVGPPNVAEQPTFYVPVAEYPSGQDARLPPRALTPTPPMTRGSDPDGLDEETKSDDPMADQGTRLSDPSRDEDQDLRDANRQISELRAALAAQDEQERLRHEDYRAARAAQAAQTKISREEWEYREAEYQDRATREAERKKAAAEVSRRMEEVSEQCNQAISRTTVAIEETKIRADEDLIQIEREMEHQDREDQARVARDTELREDELEELQMYREQAAAGRARRQARESTESPVGRYLRLKQESRETPRTFLWRLNAAATKANVDYHYSTSGCRRHVNQFLKNLRDRELQLSLQGRVYFTTDELEDVLKQVVEMEQGMRRKLANDVQFGRHKPQGTGPVAPARGGSYAAMAAPEIPEPQ